MRKEENFSKEYFKTVVRCIENLYFDGCNIYIKYYTLEHCVTLTSLGGSVRRTPATQPGMRIRIRPVNEMKKKIC